MPDIDDKSDFVTELRAVAALGVEFINRARAVLNWNQSTAMLDSITDTNDPVFATGDHQGLVKADITNGVNSLTSASTWYDAGHNTNLQNIAHN